MLRVITSTLLAAAVRAQAPTWLGIRPSTKAPSSLDLIDLADDATVNSVIGTIALGEDERAWPDALRCLPGFCLFATSLVGGASAVEESFVYKVNSANAAILYKVPVRGICAHMHVDFQSGHAYTLCIERGATGFRAEVVEVTGAAPISVADISTAVAGGRSAPGQTTHCSAFDSMYVGVDHGGAGKDVVITVDLAAGTVSKVTTLQAPLARALWATCDGSGVIGGVSFVAGDTPAANGTATFGGESLHEASLRNSSRHETLTSLPAQTAYDAAGKFVVDSTVGVFPNHVPSGMLTGTSPASYKDAFIATFYPPGTASNSTAARGAIWSVDPYGGGTDDVVAAFPYFLIGAAWDREGARRV